MGPPGRGLEDQDAGRNPGSRGGPACEVSEGTKTPLGTGLEAICVNSGQEPSCILLVSWEGEGCRIQKQRATLLGEP